MKKLAAIWQARTTCFWHEWLLFAVAVYLVYPLFAEGYFVGHETLAPQFRVYGINLAVASGQFPAKVLPNLVNGLGYGWNIFYSPLAYDVTWSISALGFSYTTSLKLVHFLAILLSDAFLYLLVMRITVNRTAALIAAVLYMTAPYRLADLYTQRLCGIICLRIFAGGVSGCVRDFPRRSAPLVDPGGGDVGHRVDAQYQWHVLRVVCRSLCSKSSPARVEGDCVVAFAGARSVDEHLAHRLFYRAIIGAQSRKQLRYF